MTVNTYILRDEHIRTNLLRFIGALPLDNQGKPWRIRVDVAPKKRTLDQNSKMHAMFGELAKHVGHSANEIKDYMKDEYGPAVEVTIGNVAKWIKKSTADYTPEEAGQMIDRLYERGAMVGLMYQESAA